MIHRHQRSVSVFSVSGYDFINLLKRQNIDNFKQRYLSNQKCVFKNLKTSFLNFWSSINWRNKLKKFSKPQFPFNFYFCSEQILRATLRSKSLELHFNFIFLLFEDIKKDNHRFQPVLLIKNHENTRAQDFQKVIIMFI